MTSVTSFWCFYSELSTYFTIFSSVSIADFEQVNISWEGIVLLNSFFLVVAVLIKIF